MKLLLLLLHRGKAQRQRLLNQQEFRLDALQSCKREREREIYFRAPRARVYTKCTLSRSNFGLRSNCQINCGMARARAAEQISFKTISNFSITHERESCAYNALSEIVCF